SASAPAVSTTPASARSAISPAPSARPPGPAPPSALSTGRRPGRPRRTSRTEAPMADGYQTREQVAAKVDWEGGIPEALEYGLTVDDMPAGDEELRAAWGRLEAAHQPFAAAEAEV